MGSVATPCASSVTVQEISECLLVLCLSLKATGTDGARELSLGGRCLAGLFTLSDDLLSVRVGGHLSFVVDLISLQGQSGIRWANCARLLGATWAGLPQER